MKIMLIVLAFFSFGHERYEIKEYTCENNVIKIYYQDHWYEVSLFNIVLEDEVDVCSYLNEDLVIEIDPLVKIENPLNAYVFSDDKLLQQKLIDDGKAKIKIANPKYKYLLKPKKEAVISKVEDEKEIHYPLKSRYIASALIILWVICIVILIFRFYRVRR